MNAEFLSPAGKIISKWNIKEDGSVDFYFEVRSTPAELVLPDIRELTYKKAMNLKVVNILSYKPNKPYKENIWG